MRNTILFLALLIGVSASAQKLGKLIEKNDPDKLQAFIDKGGDLNQEIQTEYRDDDSIYYTHPIIFATVSEATESLKTLIKNKDKIDNYSEYISKAFVLSLSRKDPEIADILFAEGPDVNVECEPCHHASAIMIAASTGKQDWYFKLKPMSNLQHVTPGNQNLLHYAASSPNENITKDVIKIEGLDINMENTEEVTPLAFAMMNIYQPNLFNEMIGHGADPMATKDLVEFAIEGNNLDALIYADTNDLPIPLWDWNDYSSSYLLQYCVFMHDGPDGGLIYSSEQDEFVDYLMWMYINSAKELENTEEMWDPVYNANTFYNLIDLSLEFDNLPLLDTYFRLVAEVQEVENAVLVFPKKYFKYAVKAWGDMEIGSLLEKYSINTDYSYWY
ncbi:MAG: hypothetical protein MK078_11915 [Crocinitomicaceae bacterium]|nr:hypothetical protein [Crocinitomicaceae bacterium]